MSFYGKDFPDVEVPPPGPGPDGYQVLDQVDAFLARFVAYPSAHARVAHVLWIAHTHLMERWESTPRIAFLSPEPGSGKSRCLEVTEPLVPRPVHAVNTTPAYLFRKVSDPEGAPTILYDEVDTVFGPKAKDNEDVRGMLNAGHRRGATAGRCVVKGKQVETEELPAYCAVALAGLNDLPDTIMTRSVVVRMRRRSPQEKVEPWRLRINGPEADELREALVEWSRYVQHIIDWPEMPEGIVDRNADVWEALLAVADAAGGRWPTIGREAAVALVSASSSAAPSIGVLLLRDLKSVFDGRDKLSTDEVLGALHELEESPWGDLRGKPVDSRWLSRQLSKYDVKSKNVRVGGRIVKGYHAADLADPWSRYVSATPGPSSATSATPDPCQDAGCSGCSACSGLSGSPEGTDVADEDNPFRKLTHPPKTTDRDGQTDPAPVARHKSATSATPATPCAAGCGLPLDDSDIFDGFTTHATCHEQEIAS